MPLHPFFTQRTSDYPTLFNSFIPLLTLSPHYPHSSPSQSARAAVSSAGKVTAPPQPWHHACQLCRHRLCQKEVKASHLARFFWRKGLPIMIRTSPYIMLLLVKIFRFIHSSNHSLLENNYGAYVFFLLLFFFLSSFLRKKTLSFCCRLVMLQKGGEGEGIKLLFIFRGWLT